MALRFIQATFILFSTTALASSTQLVIVHIQHWTDIQGQIQRYQRATSDDKWRRIGTPIPVVVGQGGMAWEEQRPGRPGPIKVEGDAKTPAGTFDLSPAFGFAAETNSKLAYLQLTPQVVCVDDVHSKYYNQVVNSADVSDQDWSSAEPMAQVSLYRYGAVVKANPTNHPGSGSCIFLHIWRTPYKGTAGCVAMAEGDLKVLLGWLDQKANPQISLGSKD